MAYNGEHLYQCMAVPFDWNRTNLVVVSGSGPNLCGHAIVNAGSYYFHIDGIHKRPWYFNEVGYVRYLKENGKKQLQRTHVPLPNPSGAQRKIEELTSRNWTWLVLPNNCTTFVSEIFKAGGSKTTNFWNCPVTKWE